MKLNPIGGPSVFKRGTETSNKKKPSWGWLCFREFRSSGVKGREKAYRHFEKLVEDF